MLVGVAYFAYIAIGIQSSLLGITWTGRSDDPAVYISETFGKSLDAVGWLLTGSTVAVFLVGAFSGRVLAGRGVGPIVAAGLAVSTLSLAAMAVAENWWLLVACSWGCSLGLGVLDASMNTWFAAHHGARLMNWLHASFGVGAALGPFVVDAGFAWSGSWRWSYGVTAVLQLAAAAAYFWTRRSWGEARPANAPLPEARVHARQTLRLAAVWAGIGMFVLYTGMEMVPGQWGYGLFSVERGVDAQLARSWMGVYFWGAFTLGRIGFGVIDDRIPLHRLLRIAICGGIVGSALLAWNPIPAVGMVPLAIYAFFTAPIWALLMLHTQRTLGPEHAPHAIGFQVSAASIGFGVVPAIAGQAADRYGLGIVPATMVGLSVAMLLLFEWNRRARVPALQA